MKLGRVVPCSKRRIVRASNPDFSASSSAVQPSCIRRCSINSVLIRTMENLTVPNCASVSPPRADFRWISMWIALAMLQFDILEHLNYPLVDIYTHLWYITAKNGRVSKQQGGDVMRFSALSAHRFWIVIVCLLALSPAAAVPADRGPNPWVLCLCPCLPATGSAPQDLRRSWPVHGARQRRGVLSSWRECLCP